MDTAQNKKNAISFLELIIDGKIDEAYKKHVDMTGKHHNTMTKAGFDELIKGMKISNKQFLDMVFAIEHVLADGDMVATHSHLKLGKDKEMIAFHLMRFKDGKIIEFWDCGQMIENMQNKDGAF